DTASTSRRISPGFGDGLAAVTSLRLASPGAVISHFCMAVVMKCAPHIELSGCLGPGGRRCTLRAVTYAPPRGVCSLRVCRRDGCPSRLWPAYAFIVALDV